MGRPTNEERAKKAAENNANNQVQTNQVEEQTSAPEISKEETTTFKEEFLDSPVKSVIIEKGENKEILHSSKDANGMVDLYNAATGLTIRMLHSAALTLVKDEPNQYKIV